MGALHEGHVALVRECRRHADFVVVSIFVNPSQFGPHEDFERYPRTLEDDVRRCHDGGAALVFAPPVSEIYPTGKIATYVEVPGLSDVLEGASRPGHFRGVATVVMKLLQIVQPDLACFGEKDYQQLQVIRRAVADLDVPVAIHAVPTVREPDGLAMSSRNRYLAGDDRRAATILHKALQAAVQTVASGERSADRVRQVLRETIESQQSAVIDYAEVADPVTLAPVRQVDAAHPAIALLAVRVGPARLIDNRLLPE